MVSNLLAHLFGSVRTASEGSFWFPPQVSTLAPETDWLFHFILWICIFFTVLVTGLMVAFVWSYRRRPGVVAEKTATHHTALELTWTILPSLILVMIFYFGVNGFIEQYSALPRNAREVQVTGQKWKWLFQYPNGLIDGDLHVPVDEPTTLVLRSEDVLHSLFIPAFRTKMDVVPGRYRKMWFNPTEVGTYQIFCAEYCGQNHSGMLAQVVVHTAADYEKWLRTQEETLLNKDPKELGADLYKSRGCMQCHSTDGTKGIGPSFKGIYGHQQPLSDGTSVLVDENYIHESIMEPQAKVVQGFAPVMPTFKGKLKDKEIAGIIEFIKSLKD